ncbi:methyl-accepting chemotaxis protein [Oceanibaculum pacificum]|uniref:methyl-accepting chemotaxis protein n=1 Tax=Oceanibaculum pacificum TaxID=580166 RepID=UPI000ACA2BF9|nr:methyl-accepting chemotaxis protein [Oceanibaculum pacificum]
MKLSVKMVLMGVLFGLGAILLASGVTNVVSLRGADKGLRLVYNDRVLPLEQLKAVSDDYAVFIVDASHKVRNGNFSWEEGQASVRDAVARIEKTWPLYAAGTRMVASEKKLLTEAQSLLGPADKLVMDLGAILQRKDAAALDDLVKNRLYQTLDPLTEKIGDLALIQAVEAEKIYEEAHARDESAVLIAEILVGLGLIATAFGFLIVIRRVTRPIDRLTATLRVLAADEYSIDVPFTQKGDEIGEMARAIDVLKAHGLEAQQLRAAQEEQRAAAEKQKAAALEAMAAKVESETRSAVDRVSERTEAMDLHAGSMAQSAENVSMNSQGVAAAAQQALHNAETVASAAEEMAASIREISVQVNHGSSVSRRAVETGERTQRTIATLSDAVMRIGEVATLISDIAAQTNLLALNATIEAARAGEAGKGFAVVASEVKNLAGQTAKATEEIGRQIGEIQSVTRTSVDAVREIGSTIEEMNHISSAISAAIEEQGAATEEISRNITQAAQAAREVSARIDDVSHEAGSSGTRAATVRDTAAEVAQAIASLRQVLVRVVRTSMSEVDRRKLERVPFNAPCTLALPGRTVQGQLENLSEGGALVSGVPDVPAGARGTLTLGSGGFREALPCTVLEASPEGLRLQFSAPADQIARLRATLGAMFGRAA